MIHLETIKINAVNLEDQKVTDFTEMFLEIRDNSIYYYCRFYADEPIDPDDKNIGWHSVFNCFKTVAAKEKISGIELQYIPSAKKWGLFIMVAGFESDIKVFFRKESEATEVFNKIHKWLFE